MGFGGCFSSSELDDECFLPNGLLDGNLLGSGFGRSCFTTAYSCFSSTFSANLRGTSSGFDSDFVWTWDWTKFGTLSFPGMGFGGFFSSSELDDECFLPNGLLDGNLLGSGFGRSCFTTAYSCFSSTFSGTLRGTGSGFDSEFVSSITFTCGAWIF